MSARRARAAGLAAPRQAANSGQAMSGDQSDPVMERIAGVPLSRCRSPPRMMLPQEVQADEVHGASAPGLSMSRSRGRS
jgi:hypothetical protein